MIRRWPVLLLVLFVAACVRIDIRVQPRAVQLYVSNVGSATLPGGGANNCTGSGTPCHLLRALTVVACGDTINLLDGRYTGVNYMLNTDARYDGVSPGTPAGSAKTCTLGNEVTVRAVNEGAVFFDAEFVRGPVLIYDLAYWKFIGFDAGNASSADYVAGIGPTSHVTIQRVCFSNVRMTQPSTNSHVLSFYGGISNDLLMEDICAFGSGRNTFSDSANGTGNVFRRFWLRFEGWCPNSGGDSGGMTVQNPYYSDTTSPTGGANTIYENFIAVYDPEQFDSVPCANTTASGTAIAGNHARTASLPIKSAGWIVYGYPNFEVPLRSKTWTAFFLDKHSAPYTRNYVDIFVDRLSQNDSANGYPFFLDCLNFGGSPALCAGNTADRLTGIRVAGNPASVYTGFNATNTNDCTSLAACPSIYTGTPGTGSRACFEYLNGTLTSTKLWPWRMDDRIKNALARARAAGTGGSALQGGAGSGYAAATVTSEIASRYGTIPTACLRSGAAFVPDFPTVTDFPSTPVLDNFNRADGAIGANWTAISGYAPWTVASNVALPPSTFSWMLWTADAFAGPHEVYATYPTSPTCCGWRTLLVFAGTGSSENSQWRVMANRQASANALLRITRRDAAGNETIILGPIDLGSDIPDATDFGIRVSSLQMIALYWKYTNGLTYRIGTVIDTNLPSANTRIGLGGIQPETVENFGGGTCCGGAVSPANIGRFGNLFPKQ